MKTAVTVITTLGGSYNYSRVPNNRRGWNNRGGVDIVIIINNRGGWSNRGLDGIEKIV